MNWIARVHVVPKAVVNDPEGEAIMGGLRSLGFQAVQQVRSGKYLEIHVDAHDRAEAERQVDDMCRKLLANPILHDYRIEVDRVATAPRDAV